MAPGKHQSIRIRSVDSFSFSNNQAGGGLLHPPPSQSQSENISDGARHSQQELLQSSPVLFPDEAVEHRVQAAVGVSQAHSQGEGVRLGVVERFAKGHQVKLDEHPPQGESLIGQPTDEEGQNDDGQGAGDFGAAAVASSLILGPLRGALVDLAAHGAPAQDESQEEEVAHGDDNQGNYKSQEDFLCLV
ncbi:hypothetical protein EYF80_011627 [Liparis tanakae]|uniref:Uncharacterized protein n=1 Tax=Liparis tanakae TaxID=230148 RepID=A0A4Z2ILP8_9TELE|nr:hypothetical protein EYF80_011627 [Liparis tanakae]